MVGRVYVANFGQGNALWPQARANNTLATYDNVAVHGFWKNGDRAGFIEAAMANTVTALGLPPTRPTAGRWFNLMEELRDTEDDLWISRQGDSIWWTRSLPGELRESLQPAVVPARDGPEVWVLEKPCAPWSDRDLEGRPLRWSAVHPKAVDFLATEATFQKIQDDRGYASYARALVAGEPLDAWHALPVFAAKAAEARKQVGKIFSSKERAAERMTRTMFDTVANATGELTLTRIKVKNTTLSKVDCEKLLLQKMGEQEDRCAITGLPLGYDRECDDNEMLVSLDRMDSNGHYTPDNVQLVCRFVNRWKGADSDALFRRLISVLRDHFGNPSLGRVIE